MEKIKQDLFATNIGISVYPGEFELEALRDGAIRVLSGIEKAKEYDGRIHCSFQTLGADTGRTSCRNPRVLGLHIVRYVENSSNSGEPSSRQS